MSTESADRRDLVAELDQPEAGETGVAVDAVCVDCRLTRAKYAPATAVVGDGDALASFKHTCHRCRRTTWWNALRVLEDVENGGGE